MFVISDLWSDYLVCFVLFFCFFFADAPPINQDKKVSKDNFSIMYLLRTVCELTFSIKQMHYKTGTLWHSDASILLTSANVVLDKWHSESDAFILFTSAKSHLLVQKSFWIKVCKKFLQKQCTVCAAFADADISFLERLMSELVSLISCILPPLPQFRAVTCDRPLCLQIRHMWRWLTSVKLRMQSRCSLV